ncbi:LuxR C-terminal-related transcriptional regulator [Haloglycomyces albus]|uniref:LuxR C-terminal-related transcriptional regulator n=1 Tax=Haloglycomyces albus TaxID=526067 RepID=UPI00046C8F42|nr:LuxR C-terminal-related transcriptional regulator [Haloglycomyces albus]
MRSPADRDKLIDHTVHALTQPGLQLLTGPPGWGRTHLLQRISAQLRQRVVHTGGLAALRHHPALALIRATKAGLPSDSPTVLAAAALSRLKNTTLVIDDIQWCDPHTQAALPHLAQHLPILAAGTTGIELARDLTDSAHIHRIPALDDNSINTLLHTVNPHLTDNQKQHIRQHAGVHPLALATLARTPDTTKDTTPRDPAHSIATALAAADAGLRTGLATLGLLGRPAHHSLLGDTATTGLRDSGLADTDGDYLSPTSPWMAAIAAGALNDTQRLALHAKLAEATNGLESARHHWAAGNLTQAETTALAAADSEPTHATAALTLAATINDQHKLPAAKAAIKDHQPTHALRLLADDDTPAAVRTKIYAHLTLANPLAARGLTDQLNDTHPETDALRLLTHPNPSEMIDDITKRHGSEPDHPTLHAALAATRGQGLDAAAEQAASEGAYTIAYWCRWKSTNQAVNNAQLPDAKQRALTAAADAGNSGHLTWKARFLALAALTNALSSTQLDNLIASVKRAESGPLPDDIATLLAATLALATADTGDLGQAARHLDGIGRTHPLVSWIEAEYAWLDGQHQPPRHTAPTVDLATGLTHITNQWLSYDQGHTPTTPLSGRWPTPVDNTLTAWKQRRADDFHTAAEQWDGISLREKIRALLAAGYHADGDAATQLLLDAENLAEDAGLTVLDGKIKRALRRLGLRRDQRSSRGMDLTGREQQILHHISAGHPTRRIAETLGITSETVETHIRSAMRKLGAKTRTEAAVKYQKGHTT